MIDRLHDALGIDAGIDAGIVAVVGAGGKKSTLRLLVRESRGRTGLTATTRTAPFPQDLDAELVIADADEIQALVVAAAGRNRVVAYAHPAPQPRSRMVGLEPALVTRLHERGSFDLTLVKSDGARMRRIKAPGEDEPVIPPHTSLVVPVVSARVLGCPLSEKIGHRVERIAAVTGAGLGETLTPDHLARLLAHEDGSLKGTGSARVVPIINMVDDERIEELAVETARLALARTQRFDRVILASLRAESPLRQIVQRG